MSIVLPKEIDITQAHNLKAGFQSLIEIKNNSEEGYKTEIKGVEFWTPVVEESFEHYWISTKGRVWNSERKRLLKNNDVNGYQQIQLHDKNKKRKNFFVHRLVAFAFLENTRDKPEVNHIDGNKANNHIPNLEWATAQENTYHAYQTGLKEGYVSDEKIIEIIRLREQGLSFSEIADEAKVSNTTAFKYCGQVGLGGSLITEKKIEKMIELRKSGLTYEEIGEQVGVSPVTVINYCKKARLEIGRTNTSISDEQAKQIIELRKQGLSYARIGKQVGVSESSTRRKCKEAKLNIGETHTIITDALKEEMLLLREQGLNYKEIEREIGVSSVTVKKYCTMEKDKKNK